LGLDEMKYIQISLLTWFIARDSRATKCKQTFRKKSMNVSKYKTAKERKTVTVETEHSFQWQPPIRRRLDKDGFVESISLRIRLHIGDSERDFQAKFSAEGFTSAKVCELVCTNFLITPQESRMFALWVVTRDLGIIIVVY
jgi:hypothetical protein